MRFSIALLSLALGLLAVLSAGHSAEAAVDLTGAWTLDLQGDVPIVGHVEDTCTTEITQTLGVVSGTFECVSYDGDFSGTITFKPVGADIDLALTIRATGFPDIESTAMGTVLPDGNSLEGTWEAPDFDATGTFSGLREVLLYTKGDVTCDSNIDAGDALAEFAGAAGLEPVQQTDDCPALDADIASLFGDMDCDGGTTSNDGVLLLRYYLGLEADVGDDCRAIGETYTIPRPLQSQR